MVEDKSADELRAWVAVLGAKYPGEWVAIDLENRIIFAHGDQKTVYNAATQEAKSLAVRGRKRLQITQFDADGKEVK